MVTFRVGCQIENHTNPNKSLKLRGLLVDTGAEHTWINESKLQKIGVEPVKKDVQFTMANGQIIARNIGFMIIKINKAFTVDEVVFGQKGDMDLLGARSLEGLNLNVDPKRKRLVAAGPYPVT